MRTDTSPTTAADGYRETEDARVATEGIVLARTAGGVDLVLYVDALDVEDFIEAPSYAEGDYRGTADDGEGVPDVDAVLRDWPDTEGVDATDEDTGRIYWVTRRVDAPADAYEITEVVKCREAARGELIGHVGVDSGVVMIGDPCYGEGERPGALMDAIIAAAETSAEACTPRGGIAVSAAYGDGVYPVFVHRDSDGRIIRMTVEF